MFSPVGMWIPGTASFLAHPFVIASLCLLLLIDSILGKVLWKIARRRHLAAVRDWANKRQMRVVAIREPRFIGPSNPRGWLTKRADYFLTVIGIDNKERTYCICVTATWFAMRIIRTERGNVFTGRRPPRSQGIP